MIDGGGKWYILSSEWDKVGNRFAALSHSALRLMLIGEYTHALDPKKRLSLPMKFRKELTRRVVITRGLDSCLFMYGAKQWERIVEKLQQLSIAQADTRGFNRFMLSGAVEVDVDGAGRILVPDFLKSFAGLGSKVVLAGVGERVEIWDEAAWEEYKRRIEKQADAMAEKLGGVL